MADKTAHPDAGGSTAEKPTQKQKIVRDMGAFERVWLEWVDGNTGTFATIMVEENGETERMLSLEREEIPELVDALKQAEADLPGSGVSGRDR